MIDLFKKISIRSKLQIVLILVCLLSILVTGYIGYTSARKAINSSIYEGLTALRVRQADSIEAYYDRIQQEVLSLSESPIVVDAFLAFKPAFEKLNEQSLTAPQLKKLREFYKDEVFPRLGNTNEVKPLVDTYLPQSNAGRYLQYEFIADNPFPLGSKYQLNNPGDGSDYSKAHALYNPKFKRIIQLFDYYDIFLIDGETGNVIYNVSKELDFSTNLRNGIYAYTNLGNAFKQVLKSRDPNFTTAVDFETYRPSYDRPAAFIATTIFDGTRFLGSLVFQISIDRINQNMTVDGKWREVGLQETGESILVGRDYTLRSEPREFIENPEQYLESLHDIGVMEDTIAKIRHSRTPILFQTMEHPLVEKALNGKEGTERSQDLSKKPILVSYQPVQLGPFNWALMTVMDEAEAFAPINHFARRLLITAAILLPTVALLSNWISGLFTRPIARLLSGTCSIAEGDTNVQVCITSKDELGKLGQSFNLMSQKLYEKDICLQKQLAENEKLLLNVLPPIAVERMQRGERDFADNYTDVTIIYADIGGFPSLCSRFTPQASVKLLNQLIGAFDEMAETYGIDKLKTVGTSYVAVSGLSNPRIDHAKQAVDFSIAMFKTIERYRQANLTNLTDLTDLTLDIGIHSGEVVGGIIGKTKFIYEIWGCTMQIVHGIHSSPERNLIQVTEPVFLALQKTYSFVSLKPISVKGIGEIPIWSVEIPDNFTTKVKPSRQITEVVNYTWDHENETENDSDDDSDD
ncbi:adenylate/guanylate cyclase domain-containing protein [Crocosphaera sp.]|uniref:adenylate/guanylate cyclase domain-containing protein n=1 Tax=Crocosphaera sp. TaxID=2729996 RepID=UPI0026217AF2|nr:adenylate/guanylate cyclase domain-containing protein [Crocosphaera sp.]MDJ0579735.1 adenylate/guanylate cyclase domain-containing protein [Crocosphaera sp.]